VVACVVFAVCGGTREAVDCPEFTGVDCPKFTGWVMVICADGVFVDDTNGLDAAVGMLGAR
jgi:hypothetical protein